MMNLPFKLRQRTGFCTPKGPTLRQARRVQFSLDGSEIVFRAPRHDSRATTIEPHVARRHYRFAEETFRPYNEKIVLNDSWRQLDILFRAWGFYGPWFTGEQASLSLALEVVRPTSPQAGVSFFHPRAFEAAVADYLTVHYSHEKKHSHPMWKAPMNWTVVTTLPVVAARLEVHPIWETHYVGIATHHLFFPIGDHYLVHFSSKPHLFANGFMHEREKEVDPAPVMQLLNDILASLQLTLSPAAQAQQARALAGLTDTALTPTFAPLKWTTPEEDAQWAAYWEKAQHWSTKPPTT